MDRVIAHKLNAYFSREGLGLIQPVLNANNGSFEPVGSDDFPNQGKIFVTSGFDSLYNFDEFELFDTSYEENNYENRDANPDWCAYISRGKDAKQLPRTQLFHLIELPRAPDPSKLVISDLLYKPTRLICLTTAQKDLYGPFDYDLHSEDDEPLFTATLKPYASLHTTTELGSGSPKNAIHSFEVVANQEQVQTNEVHMVGLRER